MPSVQLRPSSCPIVVKIGSVPIADVLKALHISLEQSGDTRPLAIHIISVGARVAVLEAIAIRAIMSLLQVDLNRVVDLLVNVRWRSSLDEVTKALNPGSHGLAMLYEVDDIGV